MSIDWQKFYRLLDRTRVEIPEPDPSNPAQLHDISRLLARVNNHRMTLDRTMRKLERKLGSIKNDIEIMGEKLKLERADLRFNNKAIFNDCSNKEEREAALDLHTKNTAVKLAVLKGQRQQYEHARTAVETAQNTLKGAKETLNGIRQTIIAEMEAHE